MNCCFVFVPIPIINVLIRYLHYNYSLHVQFIIYNDCPPPLVILAYENPCFVGCKLCNRYSSHSHIMTAAINDSLRILFDVHCNLNSIGRWKTCSSKYVQQTESQMFIKNKNGEGKT